MKTLQRRVGSINNRKSFQTEVLPEHRMAVLVLVRWFRKSDCSMIRFVLFDAVGTVIFPAEPIEFTYSKVFAEFGITADPNTIKARFPKAIEHAFLADRPVRDETAWPIESLEQMDALESQITNMLLRQYRTSESDQRVRWQGVVRFCVDAFSNSVSSESLAMQIFERLWNHFANPDAWIAESSFGEVVLFLKRREIAWAIGSNFDSRLQRVVAGRKELQSCAMVFDSATVGFEKPDPSFYKCVEETIQIPRSHVAMIGDDELRDYIAPKLFGWYACLHREDQSLLKTLEKAITVV